MLSVWGVRAAAILRQKGVGVGLSGLAVQKLSACFVWDNRAREQVCQI